MLRAHRQGVLVKTLARSSLFNDMVRNKLAAIGGPEAIKVLDEVCAAKNIKPLELIYDEEFKTLVDDIQTIL